MRVTVTVAASAANLGPGFDCFGLALDLCNEVTLDTDSAGGVTWEGEGAGELPTDGSDLVSRAITTVASRMNVEVPSFALHGVNHIPLERGLGSSAAATVAGVVLASAVAGLGWHLDRATVFAVAAELEGHPDNAAAAVYGGFTLAMPDGSVHRFDPHTSVRPVAIVPPNRSETAAARAVLEPSVARGDAVFNLAHAALATHAFTADPTLLRQALRDRLHQAARIELADTADIVAVLEAEHLPWCVSGSGPTILAFETSGDEVTLEMLGVTSSWAVIRPGVRLGGYELV